MDDVGATRSRSQKGRRCQLGPTPDSQSTGPYQRRCLRPGEVILNDIHVSYVSQKSSKEEIETLQGGGTESRVKFSGVQNFRECKGMSQ